MEQEPTNTEGTAEQYMVVHIGNLEDCKYAIRILDEAEIACQMDVADRVRPDMALRGYYIVVVKAELHDVARQAIERKLKEDLDIQEREHGTDDIERCPACGAALAVESVSCPECGLCFE